MEEQLLPIVSTGKYAGQPITELLKDQWYIDNVLKKEESKTWFNPNNKNWAPIYNIIVNQNISTNKDGKTPEHNKLQNLFLEYKNVVKLLRKILYNKTGDIPVKTHYEHNCEFEAIFNWDILIKDIYIYKCRCDDNACGGCWDTVNKQTNDICIEIKPLLGDDYPCVLRKMKTQIELTKNDYIIKDPKFGEYPTKYVPSNYVLLIKYFNSINTTKEQLIEIFKQSHIKIIFIDEVFDNLQSETIKEKIQQIQDIVINPIQKNELEYENKLLKEKLLHAEEKIKQLEEEILSLKNQKQSKSIKDYFGKK